MTKLIYQGIADDSHDYLLIDWKINSICNYNCKYCFQLNDRTSYNISKEDALRTLNTIDASDKKNIEFIIYGGEPTLCDTLPFLLKSIQEILSTKVSQVMLVTNGSAEKEYYEEIANFKSDYKKLLYVSLHLNSNFFDIKHYINKFTKIPMYDTIDFGILGVPEKYTNIANIIKPYLDKNIIAHITPIRCGKNYSNVLPEYTNDDIEYITFFNSEYSKSFNEHYINRNYVWKTNVSEYNLEYSYALFHGFLNFRGMLCMSGYNTLRIEDNGFCRGGICYDMPKSKESIYSGYNPFKDKNLHKLIKCKNLCCGCKDNLVIPKFQ